MRAPGRDLQDFKASASQSADEAATVAARTLNTDHSVRGVMLDQPVDQPPIALRAVSDHQRCDLAAVLINQRDGVGVLVNVDSDDQGGLLLRG